MKDLRALSGGFDIIVYLRIRDKEKLSQERLRWLHYIKLYWNLS
jgi:hypothetical protein